MKITNRHNLPNLLVDATRQLDAEYAAARGPAHFTVSELTAPAQLVRLRRQHAAELVEDISERIWAVLGSCLHVVLEKAAEQRPNELTERRISTKLDGIEISGALDHLHLEQLVLTDYKLTSTYTAEDGPRQEWVEQLNLLSWLLQENGYPAPKHLRIVAFLRDFSHAKTRRKDYPQQPVLQMDVPSFPLEQVQALVSERLRLLTCRNPPFCDADQRWAKPDIWAVKKHERSARAIRLHGDFRSAHRMAVEIDGVVEFRPGENTRCERFCPVREFCPQRALQREVAA